MNEFMPNVINIDKHGRNQLQAGDTVTETRMIRGRETSSELNIIAYEKDRLFAYQSNINGLQSTYRYIFEELEEGTQAYFEADIKTSGLIMNLTKKFIVDMIKREDGDQLRYLKEALEDKGGTAAD